MSATLHKHTNRLAGQTSPYLLQHAHNPVDWYPWGEEALERARAEDRPILLSIGYSACHWCHVMERESFEDEATAAVMNRHFVSIKVDREERPDLDSIYMQAVQMMTGHGGWPMTMFLTPEGKPFFGGTYYPPESRHGLPSFTQVLEAIADAWDHRRDDVLQSGEQLAAAVSRRTEPEGESRETPDARLLDTAAQGLMRLYDPTQGGFGAAPKFPHPGGEEVLLRSWKRTGDLTYRDAALHNLRAMANGGIYDHLGGGFHRYSVDDHWLVPHFEKMLYDNAQLVRSYLQGYQASGDVAFRRVAEDTLDYLLREMADPAGGFYSTEDADSEGEEGKFYVWTLSEIQEAADPEDAPLLIAYFGVTPHGNFEHSGATVLHVQQDLAAVAARLGLDFEDARRRLERGRTALFAARSKRIRPGRDDKVLTAWNGMLLRALAEAALVLDRPDYRAAAERLAEFLLTTMRAPDGRLLRTWKPGHQAHLNAYLEDYAHLADGLVALYEATFHLRWLRAAIEIVDDMIARFADERGGFFDTGNDHERLITRPKELMDNATPAGNAVAADVLLRLALLCGNQEYQRRAQQVLGLVQAAIPKYPLGFTRSLAALDFLLGRPKEIVLVGQPVAPATQALLRVVGERFLPNRVLTGRDPSDAEAEQAIPLLEARGLIGGVPTAYVCEGYACLAPVTTPDALAAQLDAA